MPFRKLLIVSGQVYHIFSKSIAEFIIFRNAREYERMIDLLKYYQIEKPPVKFSEFLRRKDKEKFYSSCYPVGNDLLLKFVAYSLMPTHIHLVVVQLKEGGVSSFMKRILGSYTHYFNLKIKRRGPLWESRFKNVLVDTDEQLLHLTRYIHLNPTTAGLTNKPHDWEFSSYREYLGETRDKICDFSGLLAIESQSYRNFVEERIDYQRQLAKIKKLILD